MDRQEDLGKLEVGLLIILHFNSQLFFSALGKIIQNLEDDATNDIQTMQAAVPQMVAVLNQCIEETNTEGATHIVDVFETVAMCEAPVLNQYLGELIEFFLAKGADINIEEDLRHMCLNSLIWLCQYKKSKIQSLSLIKPIISKLMGIATEADPEDADEDSPSRLALRIIDTLATEMPPSQVFPHIHEQMTQYSASSDPTHRKAAMMVFGVSVEGCSEYIRPHMSQLWPFIENGLQDGEVVVRNAACVALGCLCEMLDDECAARHATLLPVSWKTGKKDRLRLLRTKASSLLTSCSFLCVTGHHELD